MADRNPGAVQALVELYKNNSEIDPESAFGPFSSILHLDENEVYGTDIYILYNDKCNRNVKYFILLLRACQLGFFSNERLKELSLDQGRKLNISDEEMIALDKQLSANPSLEAFGSQIGKEINRFEKLLASGFRIGKLKIMREIEDIKSNPDDAEEVFINMLSIAEADGNVDDDEKAVLIEVGNKLGIRLSDYCL